MLKKKKNAKTTTYITVINDRNVGMNEGVNVRINEGLESF